MSDSTRKWQRLLLMHLDDCPHCKPSVMTAENPCQTGRYYLREYHKAMKREGERWLEKHPEEWVYE